MKAVAADDDGNVVARSRIPHEFYVPSPLRFEHDAARRVARRSAARARRSSATSSRAAVSVAAMVPSLTAVDADGVPCTPGLLYGDERGHQRRVRSRSPKRASSCSSCAGRRTSAPTRAATGWRRRSRTTRSSGEADRSRRPSRRPRTRCSTGRRWDERAARASAAPRVEQMPAIGIVGPAARRGARAAPGCVLEGGTIDAMGEQLVAGARRRRRRARDLRHDAHRVGRDARAGRSRRTTTRSRTPRRRQVPRRRAEQRGRPVPQLGRPRCSGATATSPVDAGDACRCGCRTRAASACRSRTPIARGAARRPRPHARTRPRSGAPRSKPAGFVDPAHDRQRRRCRRSRIVATGGGTRVDGWVAGARRLHRAARARVRGSRRRRARRRVPRPARRGLETRHERRGPLGAHVARRRPDPAWAGRAVARSLRRGSAKSRADRVACIGAGVCRVEQSARGHVALDITIDREACMGSGNCSFWAPGVFDLDDDGIAIVARPDRAARRQDRPRRPGLPDPGDHGVRRRRQAGLIPFERPPYACTGRTCRASGACRRWSSRGGDHDRAAPSLRTTPQPYRSLDARSRPTSTLDDGPRRSRRGAAAGTACAASRVVRADVD